MAGPPHILQPEPLDEEPKILQPEPLDEEPHILQPEPLDEEPGQVELAGLLGPHEGLLGPGGEPLFPPPPPPEEKLEALGPWLGPEPLEGAPKVLQPEPLDEDLPTPEGVLPPEPLDEGLPSGLLDVRGRPLFEREGALSADDVGAMVQREGQRLATYGIDPSQLEGPYLADTREQARNLTRAGLMWAPRGALLEEMSRTGEWDMQASLDRYAQNAQETVRLLKEVPIRLEGYSAKAKALLIERGQAPIEYIQTKEGHVIPDYNDKETREWFKKDREQRKQAAVASRDLKGYLDLTLSPLNFSMRLEDMPIWKDAEIGEDVPTYVPVKHDENGKVIEEATVKMLPKGDPRLHETWIDIFNAREDAKKKIMSRREHRVHVASVNKNAEKFYEDREQAHVDEMAHHAARARGLTEASLVWGPEGLIVEAEGWDLYYEEFMNEYYGLFSIPGQFLAKSMPRIFGYRGLLHEYTGYLMDIDPNDTYWNLSASIGSLAGEAALRAGTLVVEAREVGKKAVFEWVPGAAKGIINALNERRGGPFGIVGEVFDDVRDFALEVAIRDPDVFMSMVDNHMRASAGPFNRGFIPRTLYGEPLKAQYGRQAKYRKEFVGDAWKPQGSFKFWTMAKNTMLEIPGAAVLVVHLVRGLGQIASFWSDPEYTTEYKLKQSGLLMEQMGTHLGHRYKNYFVDIGAVFNEGAFKVFLDILLAADIAVLPARIMATRALATARGLVRAEIDGLKKGILSGELALKEARAFPATTPAGAATRAAYIEVAEVQLKAAQHAATGRNIFKVVDDILMEERVFLSVEEKANVRHLLNEIEAIADKFKVIDELLKGSLNDLTVVLPKHLKSTNRRMLRHQKVIESGKAFDVTVRGAGRQIVDVELKAAWKTAKRQLARARRANDPAKVTELTEVLRDIRAQQHVLDKAKVPSIKSQIKEITTLINGKGGQMGLIEQQRIAADWLESKRNMARLVRKQRRTAVREAGISAEAHELAQNAKLLMDITDHVRQMALYALPVFGQLALVNRGIHLMLDGPGSIGIGRFSINKLKARNWWYDKNNRVEDSFLTAMREADGAAGEFVYRVAERLRAVKEADWPVLREMLKYEHDYITKLYNRNPHAPAGKMYSLREEFPSMTGPRAKGPFTADTPIWQMTDVEYFWFRARQGKPGDPLDMALLRQEHYQAVLKAAEEGRPVHMDVLSSYKSIERSIIAEQEMILRRLEVMNRHDDIIDLLLEVTAKGKEARAFYAPGKVRPVYYPEVVEKVWDSMLVRLKARQGEWVSNPRLNEAANEIAALGSKLDDHAIGIAIMENTWRKMGFSVAEREAGILLETGERLRISTKIGDELLTKLPMAVRDFEFLKAFNKMRTDPSVHRAFMNADDIIAIKERIWSAQTSKTLSDAQKTKVIEPLRKELMDLERIARDPWSIKRAETEISRVARNKRLKPKKKAELLKVARAKLKDAIMRKTLREQGWVEIGPWSEAGTRIEYVDSIIDGRFVVGPDGVVKGIINREIAGTGTYEMGNLNGMIRGDIAQELYGAHMMTKEYGLLKTKALNWFKATKTILSVGTHATNWLGNFLYLAPMAGLSPWNPVNWKYYRQAAKDFASGVKSQQFLRWVKAGGRGPSGGINRSELLISVERGIGMLYQGIFGNVRRVHRNLARFAKGTFRGDWDMAFSAGGGMWRHMKNMPKGMYQMGDDYFRYTLFLKKIDEAGYWSKANVVADASGAVLGRRSFADYENLNGLFQTVRRKWWGQVFIAFDARTVPLVFNKMAESPYGTAFMLGLHDHMSTQNMIDSGIDPHLADYALESIPDYAKFSKAWLISIFPELKGTKFEYARMNFLKYAPGGRRLPFIKNETWLQYLGRVFMSDNPYLSTYMHTQNVDPFYRGSIYKEGIGGDSPELAAERLLERIRMTWLPPDSFGLGYGYREMRIERAKRGEIPYGRLQPRSLLKEQVGRWTGLDVGLWDEERLVQTGDIATVNEFRQLKRRRGALMQKALRKQISTEELERQAEYWELQWREFVERVAKKSVLKSWLIKNYPEMKEPEIGVLPPEEERILLEMEAPATTPEQQRILKGMGLEAEEPEAPTPPLPEIE